jgi:hypothetical protein
VIHTSTGSDVLDLLDRVMARPERFEALVICVPFVDAVMLARLGRLAERAHVGRCELRLVTTPEWGNRLRPEFIGDLARRKGGLIMVRRLHAKVYLALARRSGCSEAIITSANLTRAGVTDNIELGIRALTTSEAGSRVVSEVRHFIRRLAA